MRVTLSFKTIGCILLLFSIPGPPIQAQQSSDASPDISPTTRLTGYVRDRLGPDSRLYNGYEYIRNGTPAKGFAFFNSDNPEKGSLTYDGIDYPDIPLEYDLVLDEVVIRDYSGTALISLISSKVDHFSIGSHSFRYINGDNPASNAPAPGFYEVLFSSGPVTLFARHEKKLVFPSNRDEQAKYEENTSHFLHVHDHWFRIEGKDALLDALKDEKDPLRKYIRENRIRFKKHLETGLIQVTAYYLQISH